MKKLAWSLMALSLLIFTTGCPPDAVDPLAPDPPVEEPVTPVDPPVYEPAPPVDEPAPPVDDPFTDPEFEEFEEIPLDPDVGQPLEDPAIEEPVEESPFEEVPDDTETVNDSPFREAQPQE